MRTLTPRIVGEILQHEGLAQEVYRDSVGVWSVGITDASGHKVARYRDNPQPLERCLEVFVWLLTTRYLPAVNAAFCAFEPSEHQLAAALSFHYNTGAIARGSWLKRFLAGDTEAARKAILDWRRPPEILPRRRKERDLYFDAKWSGDGTMVVYEVAKPDYHPVRPKRIDVAEAIGGCSKPRPALLRRLRSFPSRGRNSRSSPAATGSMACSTKPPPRRPPHPRAATAPAAATAR